MSNVNIDNSGNNNNNDIKTDTSLLYLHKLYKPDQSLDSFEKLIPAIFYQENGFDSKRIHIYEVYARFSSVTKDVYNSEIKPIVNKTFEEMYRILSGTEDEFLTYY